MKIVIFAGGAGQRLWPISRQSSPKQFEPIVGHESTLQLAVRRVERPFGTRNIYVSTNSRYVHIVRQQLPHLPSGNIIGEPTRRDLAPAVGLAMLHLNKTARNEPVGILWGDTYIKNVPNFLTLLAAAERLIVAREAKILFIGETPRFANDNLGWIALGDRAGQIEGIPYFCFESLTYRPSLEAAERMFARKSHVWNTGFFVTTPGYVLDLYRRHAPDLWQHLSEIEAAVGGPAYQETLERVYPQMNAISFDDAILTHLAAGEGLVLHGDIGWSDPGTLYALKETINPDSAANVTSGVVIDEESTDCLIYNYEPDKLVVAVGLDGMIVVNTEDAILVVHKDKIPLVKKVVKGLVGTDLEPYS